MIIILGIVLTIINYLIAFKIDSVFHLILSMIILFFIIVIIIPLNSEFKRKKKQMNIIKSNENLFEYIVDDFYKSNLLISDKELLKKAEQKYNKDYNFLIILNFFHNQVLNGGIEQWYKKYNYTLKELLSGIEKINLSNNYPNVKKVKDIINKIIQMEDDYFYYISYLKKIPKHVEEFFIKCVKNEFLNSEEIRILNSIYYLIQKDFIQEIDKWIISNSNLVEVKGIVKL